MRAAGVSNYGVDAVRACSAKLESRGVKLVSNQIQLSLLYPYAQSNGLLKACDELDVKVLAYSPIALGLLAGKYTASSLPSGPRRLLAESYLKDAKYNELLATMAQIGADAHGGASPAQIALAWCIGKGTTPIPGARTLSQAKSNLAAAAIKLSAAEIARLDAASAAVLPVLKPETSPFAKKDIGTGLQMFDS